VYCVIDKGRNMKMPFEGLTLLDYAINATLVFSNVVLQKGDKAGLTTLGAQQVDILPASNKKTHLNKILEMLYAQQTQWQESDYERLSISLRSALSQRSLLILFTNFESTTGMRRQLPYLRRLENGTPAAGTFDGWPKTWLEFTLLDPCCGSGHFLVAALKLIVPLRMHDEGLTATEAVDAVLRENLHGLELDPRCTQIAAFAVALAAWTTPGAAGYRPLPELHIACSGLQVGAKKDEWLALAGGDQKLGAALGRLYDLFKLAPELGSLIDPTAGGEADLLTASFADVRPLLAKALGSERVRRDEQLEATAVVAQGIAKAAELLARTYTLVATNVPYLGREKQSEVLKNHADRLYALSNAGSNRWVLFSEAQLWRC